MYKKKHLKSIIKSSYYKMLCLFLKPNSKLTKYVLEQDDSVILMQITGEVTSNGYCAWLKRRARQKDLRNWIQEKGTSVEAIIVGSPEELENMVRDAWKGTKKSKVVKVEEQWFNKPLLIDCVENYEVSWSQGTADCYKETIKLLQPILDIPREYPDKGRLVGTDELIRVAEEKNIFYSRCGLKEVLFVSPESEIGMQRSQSTRVSALVHYLVDHKQAAKDFMNQSGLPVPKGGVFTEIEEAIKYLENSNRPLVVKPAVGLNGTGVTVDVRTKEALEAAWKYAKESHNSIIMEEMVEGVDVRVVVIGGKARAALLRVPANITGDGKKTVEELIDAKNKLRMRNPRLSKNLLFTDSHSISYLQRQGHTLKSIPNKGELVFLHLKANICKGADSVSITDFIHPDLMKLAEEASSAFGVDDYWGIDLLVGRIDEPRTQEQCAIIELNSTANIENVIYPLYGPSFDSASNLVEHLFPREVKDQSYSIKTLAIEIKGIFNKDFLSWVTETANELELNGFIEGKDNFAYIAVSGPSNKVMYLLEEIYDWADEGMLVDGVNIHQYKGEVKKGFKIKKILSSGSSKIENKTNKTNKEFTILPTNRYQNVFLHSSELKEVDLDTQLFLNEFKAHGFNTEYLYEGLIKISNSDKTGITGMRHTSLFCDKVCERIYPAKKLLAYNGLPTLRGTVVKYSRKRKAKSYIEKFDGKIISTMLGPKEYITKVTDTEELFNKFWKKAYKAGTKNILIEEYIEGSNICVAVVAGKAVGAIAIEKTSVVGDGESTILQLIKEKNKKRSENPYYTDKLVSLSKDFNLNDVPAKGQKIIFEKDIDWDLPGNTEAIGVNCLLHEGFKNMAVKAVESFPGLEFAYVHMTIPNITEGPEKQKWAVAKIDTNPSVAMFHFPYKGEPCNLVKRVVEDLCLTDRTRWVKK